MASFVRSGNSCLDLQEAIVTGGTQRGDPSTFGVFCATNVVVVVSNENFVNLSASVAAAVHSRITESFESSRFIE